MYFAVLETVIKTKIRNVSHNFSVISIFLREKNGWAGVKEESGSNLYDYRILQHKYGRIWKGVLAKLYDSCLYQS